MKPGGKMTLGLPLALRRRMALASLPARLLTLATLALAPLACGGGPAEGTGGVGAGEETRIPHPDGDAGAANFTRDAGAVTVEGSDAGSPYKVSVATGYGAAEDAGED